MSKAKNREERNTSLMVLKLFIEKLQKGISMQSRWPYLTDVRFDEETEVATMVPEDVKEGQFVVFAVKGEEPKRFVIELGYLTNPAFLGLLEQAKEEYGFRQKGALAIPCRPEDLQKVLQDRRENIANARHQATCDDNIIARIMN
ncbi:auxin-responsive protein SAUR32-like [Cornus florida]|uniref:auxin-responsive protein SAUR32-like n=1 Tax=Cornus florida TaxID=4283 RepID=UPI0028A0F076|nr:auxin-responsive protein SAUR32-like [Cornus florida]